MAVAAGPGCSCRRVALPCLLNNCQLTNSQQQPDYNGSHCPNFISGDIPVGSDKLTLRPVLFPFRVRRIYNNIFNERKTGVDSTAACCSLCLFYYLVPYDKIKSRFGRPSILQLYIVNLTDAISNRVFEQTRQSRHKMKYLY